MHTSKYGMTTFIHNGDFSGEIEIRDVRTGKEIEIPFLDLKCLMAQYVRDKRIAKLEQQTAEDILS